MSTTIELCRQKGRRGFFVPTQDFIKLTKFIIEYLQVNKEITVFELIDEAVKHFNDDGRLQPILLTVKQHLVIKGVLAIKFIPGRNQVIGLTYNFRKRRISMRNLVDQPHLRSFVEI